MARTMGMSVAEPGPDSDTAEAAARTRLRMILLASRSDLHTRYPARLREDKGSFG